MLSLAALQIKIPFAKINFSFSEQLGGGGGGGFTGRKTVIFTQYLLCSPGEWHYALTMAVDLPTTPRGREYHFHFTEETDSLVTCLQSHSKWYSENVNFAAHVFWSYLQNSPLLRLFF